ncbi:AJAP1 protein, partial [Podargus strigoides]|nr:AJAP1 protein [Podargus strigoides]
WPGCPSALLTRSLSVRRSSCPLGSHAWILIAMFHLAMDLASCQPPAGSTAGRLSPRPALRHRLSRGSLWGVGSGEELRRPGPPWTCTPPLLGQPPAPVSSCLKAAGDCGKRARRHRPVSRRRARSRRGQLPGSRARLPGAERVLSTGCCLALPAALPRAAAPDAQLLQCGEALQSPAARPFRAVRGGGFALPGVSLGSQPHSLSSLFSAGLAVHQIITITVSLIMVIAALITTLVLKNCCAQSGRPRRNSHQRKLDQQEESCQNLTDFAPARVPSALDIFTAYNETLQCSHDCVRTPVPVYAEEALRSPGDYKTTFNGNRPSSSDRHLIPVAFVSEKWFEISC